ncbi:ABC transporter permease subunit [Phreatobacter stygius]|uniref:ABC transporter permease subunit n=1 Tax=Phreatobacter stygius TaxID=1940610 RepID=A0A4D7B8C3_9HYPH|nr:ABC transporter permease subunit [Phreatobacter stygius]QCI67195.1 ABC transporter permease subunit [Phreatobacter stygius]
MTAATLRRQISTLVLLVPVIALLGGFFLQPVLSFLVRGLTSEAGALSGAHVERLFASAAYTQVMWTSIKLSFWVTLASIVIGYPVAYLLATTDKTRRSYWALFVLLPFWSSFLVRTFAWIVILGRNGPVNAMLTGSGLSEQSQELLYSWFAVVIGMTNVLAPFAILTMLGVMEGIDRRVVRAAETLGARPVQAFFRVFLPLSMPGVTAAALMVFITALGFFIAPALLGSVRQTMIAQLVIQQILELTNWPFAAALCLMLLVAAFAIFALYDRFVGLSTLSGEVRSAATSGFTARAAGASRRLLDRTGDGLARLAGAVIGDGRIASRGRSTTIAAVVVVVFLLAPLLFLIPVSVSEQSFVAWPPRGLTFKWYAEIFASPLWMGAAGLSFLVAFLTSLLCFAVAVPAAFAFLRLTGWSAGMLFALMVSPLIVPRMVVAVSLFYLYARLGLVGTTLGLVIGHTVIALPFFFIAVVAVLKTYDRRLDQAAASLGASPWTTARRVTLPLVGTGLVSAALFAFVVSLDELNIALFASGGLNSTLPKLMWDEATLRFSPLLAAVSTLVLVVMSVLVIAALRLRTHSTEA